MEEAKYRLYALQANLDAHTGSVGAPCPTCGVNFVELADMLENVVSLEARRLNKHNPRDISEGEIVDAEGEEL